MAKVLKDREARRLDAGDELDSDHAHDEADAGGPHAHEEDDDEMCRAIDLDDESALEEAVSGRVRSMSCPMAATVTTKTPSALFTGR